MTTLHPLFNNVIMQFHDTTGGHKGRFHGTAGSGIIVVASSDEQKKHRWATVVALGPDCDGEYLKVGDHILVEALMWMEHFTIDGEKMWKTDETKILAVTNDKDSCRLQ